MKYNYIITIFLLTCAIVMSQYIYSYLDNNKEGYSNKFNNFFSSRRFDYSKFLSDIRALNEINQINILRDYSVKECANDTDIGIFLELLNNILNNPGLLSSTKLYMLGETIPKAFKPFYQYNPLDQKTQYNRLTKVYPLTFSSTNDYTIINQIMIIAKISQRTTSSALDVNSGYFAKISKPPIDLVNRIVEKVLPKYIEARNKNAQFNNIRSTQVR